MEKTMKLCAKRDRLRAQPSARTTPEFDHAVTTLQESGQLNLLLLDSLPMPVSLIGRDRRILAANRAARQLGATVGNYCWRDFVQEQCIAEEQKSYIAEHPHEPPPLGTRCEHCRADEALEKNRPTSAEVRALGRVWMLWWIRVDDSTYLQYAEDITEHRQLEQSLQESEARYRAIVEDQMELVCRFLPDGTLTFVNASYCRYFGETVDKLIGRQFWHHVPEGDQEKLRAHLARLTRENPSAAIEHRILTPSGELRWQQWTDRVIFDDEESILEIQAVGRDITARRHAEESLQKAHLDLERRVRQRTRELSVVNRIIHLCNEADDLPALFENVLDATLRLLDFDGGGIYLLEETEHVAVMCHSKGLSPQFAERRQRIKIDEPPYAAVFVHRAAIFDDNHAVLATGAAVTDAIVSLACVPLLSKDRIIGALSVIGNKHRPFSDEQQKILQSVGREVGTVIARMQAEAALVRANKNLESAVQKRTSELEAKNLSLEEFNTTLRILLDQRQRDQESFEGVVLNNVKTLILPYLEKLKRTRLNAVQQETIDILETHLNEITSRFVTSMSHEFLSLTPSEIKVAVLIKEGRTSKEISQLLRVAEATIQSHRRSLRKKLGMRGKKLNLRTYLQKFK